MTSVSITAASAGRHRAHSSVSIVRYIYRVSPISLAFFSLQSADRPVLDSLIGDLPCWREMARETGFDPPIESLVYYFIHLRSPHVSATIVICSCMPLMNPDDFFQNRIINERACARAILLWTKDGPFDRSLVSPTQVRTRQTYKASREALLLWMSSKCPPFWLLLWPIP